MSSRSNRTALRWVVPGAVVAIALGAAGLTAVTANATATLPPRTAAELLVDVQNADPAGFSGTIVQNAELGLPELPALGGQGSSDFSSLVSGTHTLRVWIAGQDQQRIALLGTLGESDLIRNGTDVWAWSSSDNSATHFQLPARTEDTDPAVPDPTTPAMTPEQLADLALSAIDPTTLVTTDGTVQVAGRAAYELVLAPRDTASLIGSVRIAIDAEQHIPLRVQVRATDAATPAIEVGFTAISFDVPGPEQFTFTPPPGATVTDSTLGENGDSTPTRPELDPGTPGSAAGLAEPTIVGTGWTSVLVTSLPAPDPTADDPAAEDARPRSADLGAIVGSLPAVSGDWGSGRLLQSALFSVLITDDGRLLAGAVAPETLYQAAAQ